MKLNTAATAQPPSALSVARRQHAFQPESLPTSTMQPRAPVHLDYLSTKCEDTGFIDPPPPTASKGASESTRA